ncbi:MAG: Re/Si-specific NAD(P)(+) transhydrogenase subunit alpha [Planctomycetaceae bacterium]|nr:Re/Si-specific NAD(P)(+) transhydrogenase subunit alpha [Planctomycetaceae bacterium]
MKIAVLREILPGETRAAAVPESLRRLARGGTSVAVEAGLGRGCGIADDKYASAGASVAPDAAAALDGAELVLKVLPPAWGPCAPRDEVELLHSGQVLVGMLAPAANPELIAALAQRGVTCFSLDAMPRITRAQSMDVLSSMSTVAGYQAVVLAAAALGKMMPMMMTAAGTIKPANVLVIGAGVAGLQAVATARRLGGVVKAVDTRPAVKEQILSLGAKFVPLEVAHDAEAAGGYAADLGSEYYRKEQEILAPHVAEADIIVATAMIPNRKAPLLITKDMLASMRGGSVIVDLAASAGGNCEATEPGKDVQVEGVKILAPLNLPTQVPLDASRMYASNIASFVAELVKDDQVNVDMENEVIADTLVTRDGQVVEHRKGTP